MNAISTEVWEYLYTYRCGNVVPGGYFVNKDCRGIQFKVNELSKDAFEESLKRIDFSVDYNWIRRY